MDNQANLSGVWTSVLIYILGSSYFIYQTVTTPALGCLDICVTPPWPLYVGGGLVGALITYFASKKLLRSQSTSTAKQQVPAIIGAVALGFIVSFVVVVVAFFALIWTSTHKVEYTDAPYAMNPFRSDDVVVPDGIRDLSPTEIAFKDLNRPTTITARVKGTLVADGKTYLTVVDPKGQLYVYITDDWSKRTETSSPSIPIEVTTTPAPNEYVLVRATINVSSAYYGQKLKVRFSPSDSISPQLPHTYSQVDIAILDSVN